MRLASVLLFFVFLASCANQKMRYVRMKSAPNKEVRSEKQPTFEAETTTFSDEQPSTKKSNSETQKATESFESPEEISENSTDFILEAFPEDSVTPEPRIATDSEKNEAIRAENNARDALGFSIASLLGFFLFVILGIIFISLAANRYFKARNAQYITPEGIRKLNTARIFLIIDLVLLILFILSIFLVLALLTL